MRQRPRDDRAEVRRAELAESALRTLGELGYAHTSVRDIARNSPYSHGVLHYYFEDKDALIVAAVRLFTQRWQPRWSRILADAATADELAYTLAEHLATSIVEETAELRLWYDLRTQSVFETAFRDDVLSIDERLLTTATRITDRYAELAGGAVLVSPRVAYGIIDGICQRALIGHLRGEPDAVSDVTKGLPLAMRQLVGRD